MKILVTGANGQLGYDVMIELEKRNHEAVGTDISEMDIIDEMAVKTVIKKIKPDAVIHCAAWTAVDMAEECPEKVYAINVIGTQNIARVCKELGCKMMYISTDYVFDGQGDKPWEPDCNEYHPLNVYGQTKLKGEWAVANTVSNYFIIRIAWVFGLNGNNFVKTMLNAGKKFSELRVVNDQIGTPTYTLHLARLLVDMIETDKYGYYHATNEGGYISWYEFACEIFRQAVELGHKEYSSEYLTIKSVTTKEYGVSKAKRPFNSRLDKNKLKENGFLLLPDWKEALQHYLKMTDI